MTSTELLQKKELFEKLTEYISENKAGLFQKVIDNRTQYITAVIENVYQPQNASAVLRTCDLLGVQDVHIIENYNTYKVNPQIALGASKWLNLYKYNQKEYNTIDTFNQLREKGYRIVATAPRKDKLGFSLDELPIEKGKIAVVFGTELEGLTDEAIENADESVTIPMYGFTESFNISVSAALVLKNLTDRLRSSEVDWKIPENERYDILIEWALKVINHKYPHLKDKFKEIIMK